jgi:hypothetical protein
VNEHATRIRNAMLRLEWIAFKNGSVPLHEIQTERRAIEAEVDALEAQVEAAEEGGSPRSKTCPGSTAEKPHDFTSSLDGHCGVCGYGHK